MSEVKKSLHTSDYVFLFVFGAVVAWIEAGFFHHDPLMDPVTRIGWRALVFFIPCVGIGIAALFVGVRTGRISKMAVAAVVVSTLGVMFLALPVVMTMEDARPLHNLDEYHPFLQLAPRDYDDRPAQAGVKPLRILCLGGSTTEFKDEKGGRWTEQLEKGLPALFPDRHFEVHNCGRQWYTTEHLLINYSVNLRHRQPDVIVVMEAINDLLQNADFSNLSLGPFQSDYRHFLGPLYKVIERKTFWGIVRTRFHRMWRFPPRAVVDTDQFPGLTPYRRNLQTLAAYAKADGVKVVFMTQPTLLKETMTDQEKAALVMANFEAVGPQKRWSVKTAWSGMEQYNAAVRQVAGESGVYLIDLEKAVPKSLEYFSDDVHYHATAMELIAKIVAGEFQKQKII